MSLHKIFAIFFILVWTMPSLPAEATVLKIATISPDGSSWMTKMRLGAKEVEQLTEGRVKFKFCP